MRPARNILLGILLMLLAAGCAAPVSAQDADSPTPEAADQDQGNDTEAAVASVNGHLITRAAFERVLARIAGAAATAADSHDARAIEALNTLIEQEVIAQFAEENAIEVSDEALESEISRLRENLGDTGWETWLADSLYTEEEFRAAVHHQMLAARVRAAVTAGLDGDVEHVHARHILVAAETEAEEILERLAAGEDFALLAAESSLDVTSRESGGDLGWFVRGELLDEVLTETAFSIEPGAVAGPLVTGLGYHILETLGKERRAIEAERMPFLVETIFKRWLAEQTLAADIIYNL